MTVWPAVFIQYLFKGRWLLSTAKLTQIQSDNWKEKDSVSCYQTEDVSPCQRKVFRRWPDPAPWKESFLFCLALIYLQKGFPWNSC